ncbi:MAG: double-strand break repair helicase AddA [Hyphomicrobiaceae bacterium]
MSKPLDHMNIEDVRRRTDMAQAEAADPSASVWVSANAGTGKTHVLTNRVLRLLLAGTEPARILCLTYTKAAAAEMSKRVFDKLAQWVTAEQSDLEAALAALTGQDPTPADLARARTLFTVAIETPGGLKVQTIHAFAERLLQRFPLEANVPPGFRILDDAQRRDIVGRAIDATIAEATARPNNPLGDALNIVIGYAADASFDELLTSMLDEHRWLTEASRIEEGRNADIFSGAERLLRRHFSVRQGADRSAIEEERALVINDEQILALRDHLASGSKSDIDLAASLAQAMSTHLLKDRGKALCAYLLTKSDSPRDRLMTKGLADSRPDLLRIAEDAQSRIAELTAELKAITVVEATLALYRLADRILQYYRESKAAAGALDFDDLIGRTISLLSNSSSADWVLYKLDGGLDHILVDEAQDTSPEQWSIIEALAREFFSGSGAREGVVRTLFAVGDEKQSIYSFQGAEPERFKKMGELFAQFARQATMTWRDVPLNLSFRTVQTVLDAVDRVFSDGSRTPGLTASPGQVIRHIASRHGAAGLVEVWETEAHGGDADANPWEPLSETSERAPANRLAERIAATIERWLKNGAILPSTGKPITAGDILILVRKRNPFAVPMVAALKTRLIPVAGSDRVQLTEQVAVKDLIALGDFLTLPEDDLALATVLKGPLFNLTDDDLLAVAPGRKGALWKAFLAHADTTPRYRPAAETLKRWRSKADFIPPFEFYSALLDRDGGRALMLNRLGPESADSIDEFLELALGFDDGAPPSLTGFLASLREGGHEVKRDMEHGRNEVRVMTVHGAKGLEAPIVFLPDTCTTSSGDSPGMKLLTLENAQRPEGLSAPVAWAVKGTSSLEGLRQANAAQKARDMQERNRLLYVAMTRARDRLYVAGFEGRRQRPADCWYDLIKDALEPILTPCEDNGFNVRRFEAVQSAEVEKTKESPLAHYPPMALPSFAVKRAPVEPQLAVPLAPSRLEPYAPDSEGEPVYRAERAPGDNFDRPSPLLLAEGGRFLRGTLTHALLEHLPHIPPEKRESAAKAFIERRGAGLSPNVRASIVKEASAILADAAFAPIFSPDSRAEVSIAATLPRPTGAGPALKLSGQIDRLVVLEREVLIIDYKTNRPPPRLVEAVAPAYLYQLAAYVLALSEIYPGKKVRAALLWTDGPNLMEVPGPVIQTYIRQLWDLDPASLDAS